MKAIQALLVGLMLIGASLLVSSAQEQAALALDKALKKAQADGKYRMLLRQIRLPEDQKQFGSFYDFGYRTESTCADYTDLPNGYWVYAYPYWYIWRDKVSVEKPMRAWGPEQATGKPDTPEAGDQQTAWASASQDGSGEWLMLEYKSPVWAKALHVYETFNPGSVVRITAFDMEGREVEVWSTTRPIIPSSPAFLMRPGFSRRVYTNRIKLYLASSRVPGWNEIDAVGLRDESGGTQWAIAAHASSTYGVAEEQVDPRDQRIQQLEDEVQRLKLELETYKQRGRPGVGVR